MVRVCFEQSSFSSIRGVSDTQQRSGKEIGQKLGIFVEFAFILYFYFLLQRFKCRNMSDGILVLPVNHSEMLYWRILQPKHIIFDESKSTQEGLYLCCVHRRNLTKVLYYFFAK